MKGSEKQIAWATDIQCNVTSILSAAYSDCIEMGGDPRAAQKIDRMCSAVKNAEYAGDIIELFNGIRVTGDKKRDFLNVVSRFKISAPLTEGQRSILAAFKEV